MPGLSPLRAPLVVLAGIAIVAGAAAAPAGRGANVDRDAKLAATDSPALAAADRLALADRLAAWGERQGDPVALVQAAKIGKGLGGAEGKRRFEALLARASAIAPGNPTVRALVADARAYRSRDLPLAAAGLATLSRLVRHLAGDRADMTFKGAEPAVVYVRGPADADLDLYVYDEFNNLICSDEAAGAEAQCRWRPRWTGSYLVDVRNKGDREVEYVLAANDVRPGGATPP